MTQKQSDREVVEPWKEEYHGVPLLPPTAWMVGAAAIMAFALGAYTTHWAISNPMEAGKILGGFVVVAVVPYVVGKMLLAFYDRIIIGE